MSEQMTAIDVGEERQTPWRTDSMPLEMTVNNDPVDFPGCDGNASRKTCPRSQMPYIIAPSSRKPSNGMGRQDTETLLTSPDSIVCG